MSDNIKVAIKVRPLIKREEDERLPIQWTVEGNSISQIDPETQKRSETQFHFDYIFGMHNTNEEVFNATAKPIVEAAMNGINGTIFTYGQTGSGKTYTMLGSNDEKGVIRLTVDYIFNFIRTDLTRNYLLRVSYIEIYNEKINDLLDRNRTDLKVKEDFQGHITVDCKEEVANSPESIYLAMKRGEKVKRIGETNMNERSSRSHTIFRIIIESCDKNDADKAQMEAQLNLIDLAGSERARLTGATGERFNEGRHINLSLSTLSLVIKQLSETSSCSKFINYRDSKLTRILQPSLGGNALTTIICTVTPAALDETQCTLDFAVRAKGVKNKPQVNEVISDKALLKKVMRQVLKLQNELNSKNSQIEGAKKREDQYREEILRMRINNLWSSMASAPCLKETRRRRTWAGGQSDKISLNKSHNFILPTIDEHVEKLNLNTKHEQSLMDLELNDVFKTELPDFELQLIKDQQEKNRLSSLSDDGFLPPSLTVRENRNELLSPVDDSFDLEVTPEKNLQIPQEKCRCARSPGTPKVILREKLENLQSEYNALREFTLLEKQTYQNNLSTTNSSQNLDDIEYIKKSLEDSELMCLDACKKYAQLQSEHTILQSKYEEIQNERAKLLEENQSLIVIRDKFESLESEKNDYKNKMNEALKKLKNLQDEAASHEYEVECLKEKHKNREKELEMSLNLAWNDFIDPEEKKKLTDVVHLQSALRVLEEKVASLNNTLSVEKYEKQIKELEDVIVNKIAENEAEVNRNLELTQKLEETTKKLTISENFVEDLKISTEKLQLELNERTREILEMKKRIDENDSVMDKVSTTIDSEEFLPALSDIAISRNNSHNDLLDADSKSITDQNQPDLLKNMVEEQKIEIIRLEKLLEEKTHEFSSLQENINELQILNDKLRDQLAAMQSEKTLYEGEKTSLQLIIKDKDDQLQKLIKLETHLSYVAAEKEAHEDTITELRRQLNEKILELEEFQSHNYPGEIKNLNIYIAEMECFMKKITSENDNLKEEMEKISASLTTIETEKKSLLNELETLKQQLIDSKNNEELTEMQNIVKALQDENKDLKNEKEEMNKLLMMKNTEVKNELLASDFESSNQQISDVVSAQEIKQADNNQILTLSDSKYTSRISEVKPLNILELSNHVANSHEEINQCLKQNSTELETSSIFANGSYFDNMTDISVVPGDTTDSMLLQDITINQSNANNTLVSDVKIEFEETKNPLNYTYAEIINNLTEIKDYKKLNILVNELYQMSKTLREENDKLRSNLQSKIRETDEISHDVGALKSGIHELQKTVLSLTNENADMGKRLAEERVHADEIQNKFKKLEEDLKIQIRNLENEKQSQENNILELKEKLENKDVRPYLDEEKLNKMEEIIKKYEEKLRNLTKENESLSSNLMEKIEELENIRLSKSLQYDHECKYRERIDYFIEKNTILERENDALSQNLIERIEEVEILTKALKNNVSDEIQKEVENELEKSKTLENSMREKMNTSNTSLIGDKNIKINSNSSLVLEKSLHDIITQYDENEILHQKIRKLQDEINELKALNLKLSNLHLNSCKQCIHLAALNETRLTLKREIKSVNKRLQNYKENFELERANGERLKNKADEDMNVTVNQSYFNNSYFEGVEEVDAEQQVQKMQTDLENLREKCQSLSLTCKDKFNELNECRDSNLLESFLTMTPERANISNKNAKLEKIEKALEKFRDEYQHFNESLNRIDADLQKMKNKKPVSQNEVDCLKAEKKSLEEKLENTEARSNEIQKEVESLREQVRTLKDQLDQVNAENRDLYELKEVFEKQIENHKNENKKYKETVNELTQSLIKIKESHESLEVELKNLKSHEKEEVVDFHEYKQEIANLEAQVQELKNSLQYSEDTKNILKSELDIMKSKLTVDPEEVSLLTENLKQYKLKVENLESSVETLKEQLTHYTKENLDLSNEITKLQMQSKVDLNETDYRMEVCDESFVAESKNPVIEELNALRARIMKELQSLEANLDSSKLEQQSVCEVFCLFVKTLLSKEQEVVKTLHRRFEKEKNQIDEEKKQLLDTEKRLNAWIKELEAEIEKLQSDLSKEEAKNSLLKAQIVTLENSIMDADHEKQLLKNKMVTMESDFNLLQNDLEKNLKHRDSQFISQEKEKFVQDAIENFKAEYQIKMDQAVKEYKRKIEELVNTVGQLKTENKELKNNLEGLEANEHQLKSIIDLKTSELNTVNRTIQRLQKELENLKELFNQSNEDNQAKSCKIEEITGLLKVKCDKMSEYKTKLETIIPEYETLKIQTEERQLRLESYKTEIENLKDENMKQISTLKDELSSEQIKSAGLTKQLNDITNRNTMIQMDLEALKEKCKELELQNDKLVKKMRNSTSKVTVERNIEELKDENRDLAKKLEGASNRITELQKNKADLLKEFVELQGQYHLSCQDNKNLKSIIENYQIKFTSPEALDFRSKYDYLVLEKNKIALELEEKRLTVNQLNNIVQQLTVENEELKEKNKDLDEEMDDMVKKIREMDEENGELLKKVFEHEDREKLYKSKLEKLGETSKNDSPNTSSRSKQHRSDLFNQNRNLDYINETESNRQPCECENLRKTIVNLERDLVLKNAKIESLKLELEGNAFPYKKECVKLEEALQSYKTKNRQLANRILVLESTSSICERCKSWHTNRSDQGVQTDEEKKTIWMNGESTSGVVQNYVKDVQKDSLIKKLKKEKEVLKILSISRLEQIRELKKKINEFEQMNELKTPSSSGHRLLRNQDNSMKENVPSNVLGQSQLIPHRYWHN
ncbi:kinesin-related protein 4-like [Chelonus insularis]|uniref:kinesin-related protein 4-like n=1 Tax=Chelonus insularis TaxID=460826 RepID=UPI00158DF6FA|nr:kinesin-related protein 4-like [Chelonus insularis]